MVVKTIPVKGNHDGPGHLRSASGDPEDLTAKLNALLTTIAREPRNLVRNIIILPIIANDGSTLRFDAILVVEEH